MRHAINKNKPLTKVQQAVMARFENGQRLAIFETRRMSGDAIFWVIEEKDGWRIVEKALHPQLRRLFWDGKIDDSKVMRGEGLPLSRYTCTDDLHREGVIGF